MAGYDETVISEAVRRLKGKEFAREIVFVPEIKNSSGDPVEVEMEVAAVIDMVLRKLMTDKAKHFAGGYLIFIGNDEIQKEKTSKAPVETGKTAAVINDMDKASVDAGKAASMVGKIQTEKMDKAPVDGEKNQFSSMTREAPVETGKEAVAIGKNQTERCHESDPPAGKHRLPADGDYVRTILAMPTELSYRIPYSRGNNVGELLGVTEEWLEKKRQRYREAAARSERICNEFALFQEKIREESDRLGYVEVDDEYLDGVAELQEYSKEL